MQFRCEINVKILTSPKNKKAITSSPSYVSYCRTLKLVKLTKYYPFLYLLELSMCSVLNKKDKDFNMVNEMNILNHNSSKLCLTPTKSQQYFMIPK